MTTPPHKRPRASHGAPATSRSSAALALQTRDLELLKLFTTFKLATTAELFPFLTEHFPTPFLFWRRTTALARAGYLTTPPAQTLRLHAKRGRPAHLYTLGTKGARELRAHGFTLPRKDFTAKATHWKSDRLEHPLLTTRVLAPLLLALRHAPRFTITALFPEGAYAETIRVAHDGHVLELPIIPDALLTVTDHEEHARLALFLEIDCATEPLTRTGFERTSFFRKLLAYRAAWDQKAHLLRDLEADTFLVLTVATTTARTAALRALAARTEDHTASLFWFADAAAFSTDDPNPSLFSPLWTTAAGDVGALF